MKGIIKRNWLNFVLFTVMSILIYAVTMMNSLIDSGRTSFYAFLQHQFESESQLVLQQLHNDMVRDIDNKILDINDKEQLANYVQQYYNQLRTFNQNSEFYLLDATKNNEIIYPKSKQGETYDIVNKTYRLYKVMNIPIYPNKDYNYLAVSVMDGKNLYPSNLLLGLEKLKQITLYVLVFDMLLYLIVGISFSYFVRKNHFSNHSSNSSNNQGDSNNSKNN